MLLREAAPSTLNPVPLREFAAHLRVSHGFSDDGTEDALLELYLRNATAMIETRTERALIQRAYTLQVSCWNRHGHLLLPIGPVPAIDAMVFIEQGVETPVSASDYFLEPATHRQRVTGVHGGALPSLSAGSIAELRFTAGYGPSWNQVPDDLRQAVLLLAAHFYENRDGMEEADDGLPYGVVPLLGRYQPVRL